MAKWQLDFQPQEVEFDAEALWRATAAVRNAIDKVGISHDTMDGTPPLGSANNTSPPAGEDQIH